MNTIKGTVISVNSANGLCEVEVKTPLGNIYAVVLESPGEAEFVKQKQKSKMYLQRDGGFTFEGECLPDKSF
jgi:hypothetical protein